jgi:hypothetical protein
MKTHVLLAVAATLCASAVSLADDTPGPERYAARLAPSNETPAASSTASGRFTATVDEVGQTISYELHWEGLNGGVQQAHIHFGQPFAAGGISIWLCGTINPAAPNLAGPAGTQICPASATATISGTITPANVIGPVGQGIAAGEFAEIVRAIRVGFTYANVHSTVAPGGEIRGTLRRVRGRGDHDD